MEGWTHANVSLLNARKPVYDRSEPVLSPIVWHVGMYDLWRSDRRVNAQPGYRARTHELVPSCRLRATYRLRRCLDEVSVGTSWTLASGIN